MEKSPHRDGSPAFIRTGYFQGEIGELEETRIALRCAIPVGRSPPEIAGHYHLGRHENFVVHLGRGTYRDDGVRPIAAGERMRLPVRVNHLDPYSDGSARQVADQIGTVPHPAHNAIRHTLGPFSTIFDREASGNITLDGAACPPLGAIRACRPHRRVSGRV